MARLQQDIAQNIYNKMLTDSILSPLLTNQRDSALYRQIIEIISGEIAIIEQNNDNASSSLIEALMNKFIGSTAWYGWATKNIFQNTDTLVFNQETGKYGYAVEDDDLKIVQLASSENEGGQVIIKAAKINSTTELAEALTTGEKNALIAFWEKYGFAGVNIQVVSQAGDEVYLAAYIEVDSNLIDATGTSLVDGSKPVEDAINQFYSIYQTENTFNSMFYVRELEEAIKAVNGVYNVVITTCQIKPLGGSYNDALAATGQKYRPRAGWLKEDSANLLTDNLTYSV